MMAGNSALQAARDFAELGHRNKQRVDVFETSMFGQRGAIMSPCGSYRWLIWETWSLDPFLGFGLLNPSTASHLEDDPTWVRCRKRAGNSHMPRFGGVLIWNEFAFRATEPEAMKQANDPVGLLNNMFIDAALDAADRTICGWGAHGSFAARDQQVKARMRAKGVSPYCLTLTKGGQPGHPLYLKEVLQPQLWDIG